MAVFLFWACLLAQLVKNPPAMWETWVWSLGWEDPLEKRKATHSSILAWRIPRTIQSMRLQRVGHDWVTELNWTECDSLGQREINGNCWVRLSGKLIKWACRLSWHALCPVPFYLSAVCSATMMAEVGETLQKSEEMAKRFAEISTLNLFIFIFPNWSIVDLQYCVNFCCTIKWLSYTYMGLPCCLRW